VRALVFDVFGTLVDWRSGIAAAFRESGLSRDPGELADAWRARYWPLLAQVNEGTRPWENFDQHHLLSLNYVLSEQGVELSPEERRGLLGAWHRLDPWPDVPAGLEAVRTLRVTAALSNAHVALLVDLARHSDLRFDCLLSAELAHAYKPAAEVYRSAARLLALEPPEVMMVAAHPLDLAGARAVGLQTAFIDRPHEYGPGSAARQDPEATVSVRDLHELAEWLAG
jgi:2-haloacid dehalogenase